MVTKATVGTGSMVVRVRGEAADGTVGAHLTRNEGESWAAFAERVASAIRGFGLHIDATEDAAPCCAGCENERARRASGWDR